MVTTKSLRSILHSQRRFGVYRVGVHVDRFLNILTVFFSQWDDV